MSTDEGRKRILNPSGDTPNVSDFHVLITYPGILNRRVNEFLIFFFDSENVSVEIELLKEEILSKVESIASTLFEMENEWINETERGPGRVFLPNSLSWISIWEYIWFVYRAIIRNALSIGKEDDNIDELYIKCKSSIKKLVQQYFKSNECFPLFKIIENVTETLLPNRLKHLKTTVEHLRGKRMEILANRRLFNKLAREVKGYQETVESLHSFTSQDRNERNTTGLF